MPAYNVEICGIYTALNVESVQTRVYKLKRVQHFDLAVEIQDKLALFFNQSNVYKETHTSIT